MGSYNVSTWVNIPNKIWFFFFLYLKLKIIILNIKIYVNYELCLFFHKILIFFNIGFFFLIKKKKKESQKFTVF